MLKNIIFKALIPVGAVIGLLFLLLLITCLTIHKSTLIFIYDFWKVYLLFGIFGVWQGLVCAWKALF